MQLLTLVSLAFAIALILAITFYPLRHMRQHMSPEAFKHLYLQHLTRTAGWAVGSYVVWFMLVSPILSAHGIQVPRPH